MEIEVELKSDDPVKKSELLKKLKKDPLSKKEIERAMALLRAKEKK